jgi:hypothetical protein
MNIRVSSCVLLFLGTLAVHPGLAQTPVAVSVEKVMTQSDRRRRLTLS